MGRIFCVMGKSASGKDTIYKELMAGGKLPVRRIIPYTTRPVRDGEIPGENYFFCTDEEEQKLEKENRIIEMRAYQTIYGVWKYFTADDGQIDLANADYLQIGTLESYVSIRRYFGADKVIPIYIEVEDGDRLLRAIAREKTQKVPKYEEMCRRFLADAADFSEDKLKEAGVDRRFENTDLRQTIQEISSYILGCIKEGRS